mmetsp:Transcript_4497/g.9120  ORF Transcript_4497/g.9120 Transcript_4497/m.9120 type:complete len:207 (+) Transcript_4497:78-698(+)
MRATARYEELRASAPTSPDQAIALSAEIPVVEARPLGSGAEDGDGAVAIDGHAVLDLQRQKPSREPRVRIARSPLAVEIGPILATGEIVGQLHHRPLYRGLNIRGALLCPRRCAETHLPLPGRGGHGEGADIGHAMALSCDRLLDCRIGARCLAIDLHGIYLAHGFRALADAGCGGDSAHSRCSGVDPRESLVLAASVPLNGLGCV